MLFRKILCPIDLSPSSIVVLRAALAAARAFGAEVWVLHVNDAIGPRGRVVPPWSPRVLESPVRDRLASQVRQLIRQAGGGFRESVAVRHGEPVREIVRYARSLRPDLTVMGLTANGRAFEAPSVTESVAGFLPSPVLCVPTGESGAVVEALPVSVLCASDLSSASGPAADLALALVLRSGGRLTMLHVLQPGRADGDTGALRAARAAETRLKALWPDDLARRADIEYLVTPGSVDQAIADTVERCRADLVVVGRSGSGVPLGPIVRHVIRQSRVPVLVAGASAPRLPDAVPGWSRASEAPLPSEREARQEAFR